MTKHKLDIFETLSAIDRRDFDYLDKQPEEARKGFVPLVVLRWASSAGAGVAHDINLMLVNEKANRHFFDLYDFPDLQYKLMASAGDGRQQRHHWIAPSKPKRSKSSTLVSFLVGHWPDANDQEIDLILNRFTRSSFEDFINGCACEPAEAKDLLAAFDRYHGIEKQGVKKGRRAA